MNQHNMWGEQKQSNQFAEHSEYCKSLFTRQYKTKLHGTKYHGELYEDTITNK